MTDDKPTVADAHARYDAACLSLANALRERFSEPETLAEMMISVADEYGAGHAVEKLFAAEGTPASPAVIAALKTHVEAALEAHDALDLTLAGARETNGRQIIHIHGARYEVDTHAMVLRGGDGATIALDIPHAPQPTPTLLQQMQAISGVDPTEPRSPEPRERGR